MEAKPKSRALTIACSLLSTIAGCAGAFVGVFAITTGGIPWVPEKMIVDALFGGAILGFGVGYGMAKWRPDRPEWYGRFAVSVLIVFSGLVSGALGGMTFTALGRYIRG
jgi:hypothetical protein